MGRTQVSVFLFMSVRAWQVEPQLVVLPAGPTHTHKSAHISPLTRTPIHTEAKSHGRLTDFPVKPCWFFSLVTLRFAGLLFVSFACHAVERVLSYRCALRMQLCVCVCVWGPSYPCVHACGVHAMSLCKLPALCRRCFRFCCRLSLVFYRFLVVLVVILPAYPCSFCLCSTPFSYFSCGCASSLAGFFNVSVF